MNLAQAREAGIPVYRFGSPELAALHDEARDPPEHIATRASGWDCVYGSWHARGTYPIYRQVYGWQRDGFRYVVDHGGFHTLNTIHRGQVVPESEFLEQ